METFVNPNYNPNNYTSFGMRANPMFNNAPLSISTLASMTNGITHEALSNPMQLNQHLRMFNNQLTQQQIESQIQMRRNYEQHQAALRVKQMLQQQQQQMQQNAYANRGIQPANPPRLPLNPPQVNPQQPVTPRNTNNHNSSNNQNTVQQKNAVNNSNVTNNTNNFHNAGNSRSNFVSTVNPLDPQAQKHVQNEQQGSNSNSHPNLNSMISGNRNNGTPTMHLQNLVRNADAQSTINPNNAINSNIIRSIENNSKSNQSSNNDFTKSQIIDMHLRNKTNPNMPTLYARKRTISPTTRARLYASLNNTNNTDNPNNRLVINDENRPSSANKTTNKHKPNTNNDGNYDLLEVVDDD